MKYACNAILSAFKHMMSLQLSSVVIIDTKKMFLQQIIEEIHDTRLFRIVRDALKATMKTCIKDDFLPEKVSLVLLIKVKQMLQETPSSQVGSSLLLKIRIILLSSTQQKI